MQGPDFNIVACLDSPSLKMVVDPIFFANILFIDILFIYNFIEISTPAGTLRLVRSSMVLAFGSNISNNLL